ncbi:MAG: hypothetical protein MUF64_26890, partial [Polyangiaceae bacterium]|nr:hypothetical protein [Polyangiaceae bacterium]
MRNLPGKGTEEDLGDQQGVLLVEEMTGAPHHLDGSPGQPRRHGPLLPERHRPIPGARDQQRLGAQRRELLPEPIQLPPGHHRQHRPHVLRS